MQKPLQEGGSTAHAGHSLLEENGAPTCGVSFIDVERGERREIIHKNEAMTASPKISIEGIITR